MDILTIVGTVTKPTSLTKTGSILVSVSRKLYYKKDNTGPVFVNAVLGFSKTIDLDLKNTIVKYYQTVGPGDLVMFQLEIIEVNKKTLEKEASIFGAINSNKFKMLRKKNVTVEKSEDFETPVTLDSSTAGNSSAGDSFIEQPIKDLYPKQGVFFKKPA